MTPKDELYQPDVLQLRRSDQIVLMQDSREKRLSVGVLIDHIARCIADMAATKAPMVHVHPVQDVNGLASVATSGSYADLAGKPAIPAAQVNADWASVSGVTQILNRPSLSSVALSGAYADLVGKPTIPAAPVNADWNAVSGLGQILNKPTIPAAQVQTDWNAANGLGQILNKPTIPAAQIQSDWNQTNSNALDFVKNKPVRNQSSTVRSLNSAFQISATRDALVMYSVQITVTASIASGQDGDLFLEIASNIGFTQNVQTLMVAPSSQSFSLAIALQGIQKTSLNVIGYVPAGYFVRLRPANNLGNPAFLYRYGQEVLL